ncbi:MAG: NADH-quinone oxidoreductase subunit NuoG [Bdellovibrionales bacterium]
MKVTVNGVEIEVAPGTSVLQACEAVGIEIPRFCYHDRLSVAGNCRMCLVEVEKSPKPVASCAMPCNEGMVIKTDTPVVAKARKGVMEMLLINHPLDCPICDQGGECDLQDQAVGYGFDRSRFFENKRAVKDKELGPLIKTVMTRCIHCTRCVRFADEVAGTPVLGATGRGEDVEIGTYIQKAITTELSGNLIDICPVGALTSKPFAFTARPWELRKTETIDVLDAVGSNIRVDARGNEVMRVLPRLNEDINEEWINDKTRFAYDGLKRQRLDRPYVRKGGKLIPASWDEALALAASKLKAANPNKIAALAGDLVDMESTFALRQLLESLQVKHMDCRQDGGLFDTSHPVGYRFNSTIAGIEQADAILLIGTDPRTEAALVNARIRKRWLKGGVKIALVGPEVDLTYQYEHLGTTPLVLEQIARGVHAFATTLKNAQFPMLIIGSGALAREDGLAIQAVARQIAEAYNFVQPGWNGFNVLHRAGGRVGALALGFVPQGKSGMTTGQILYAAAHNELDVLYLHGADEIDTHHLGNAFVIYQGHHGDAGAHRADVIFPGAAYTEKNATYMNTEGRAQLAKQAAFPPGEAKEDWKIIRALSAAVGQALPYDTLAQLRKAMAEAVTATAQPGTIEEHAWLPFAQGGDNVPMQSSAFVYPVENFYMTDVISRASSTMAKCSTELLPHSREAAE